MMFLFEKASGAHRQIYDGFLMDRVRREVGNAVSKGRGLTSVGRGRRRRVTRMARAGARGKNPSRARRWREACGSTRTSRTGGGRPGPVGIWDRGKYLRKGVCLIAK